jgi:hypothetical protein
MNRDELKRNVASLATDFGIDPVKFAEKFVGYFPPPPSSNGNGTNGHREVNLTDLTDLEVQQLPPLSYLVEPLIPRGALIAIAAPKGSAKTFLALDQGLTVAARGEVVLMVALEGLPTHRDRVLAWKQHHGIPAGQSIPGLHWRPLSYRLDLLRDDQVVALIRHIKTTAPVLTILDNLNFALPDDENNPKVIGQGMNALCRIREAMGVDGTLIVLDNFGHAANRLRGHSRKGDAFDTVIYLKRVRDDGTEITSEDDEDEELDRIKVRCGYERNGPKFKKFFLRFEKVGDSGVLVPAERPQDPLLAAMADGAWYSTAELMTATGKSRATVKRRLAYWVEQELIIKEGDGNSTRYRVLVMEMEV